MNKNRLYVRSQRERGLCSVCSDVFQEPIWGRKLLYNFINDTDSGIECSLNMFVDNTKLCSAIDSLEERDAIKRDLDRLEKGVHVNKVKCKMTHLGRGNPKYEYKLGVVWRKNSPTGKD